MLLLFSKMVCLLHSSHSHCLTIRAGREIFAHKMVLAFRCEQFHTMFLSGMKESNMNRIQIDEYSYEVFLALLHFLYTARVRLNTTLNS